MDLARVKYCVAHIDEHPESLTHCNGVDMAYFLPEDVRGLIAEVAQLESECKERVAEKMEWLSERSQLNKEVERLNAMVTYDCRESGVCPDLQDVTDALQLVTEQKDGAAALLKSIVADLTRAREENERLKGEVERQKKLFIVHSDHLGKTGYEQVQAFRTIIEELMSQLVAARAEGYAQGVEDAAKLADDQIFPNHDAGCDGCDTARHLAKVIRALAPAAPVIPVPARTYEDGMRDMKTAALQVSNRAVCGLVDMPGGDVKTVAQAIHDLPILAAAGNPPTVGEVVTCEWVPTPRGLAFDHCHGRNYCHGRELSTYKFCPYCGKLISIKEAL